MYTYIYICIADVRGMVTCDCEISHKRIMCVSALGKEKNPDVPGRLFNNNAIFTITAADAASFERALVLRVLNCHPWRRSRNGPNEVATLKWLEAGMPFAMPAMPWLSLSQQLQWCLPWS